VIAALLLFACGPAPAPERVVHVRGGLVGGPTGRLLADGRRFEPGPPAPDAPWIAECVPLARVPLGDLTMHVARGISSPDTALAFSPDGAWLAVGTWLGEVLVIDGWTGEIRSRRTLAESAVKRVAWSPDGGELYAAEQSPDGWLRALDPATLADRARFRLADELESSAPPGADDLFGLYTLPGAYGLEVESDGTILLLGAHGWDASEGRRNRSRLWRLRRVADRFERIAAWPADGPADATLLALALEPGGRLAVAVHRSAGGPAPALPVGGVAVLDADLIQRDALVPPPLTPWFDRATVFDAIGLQPGRVTLGLADGRVWRPDVVRDLGAPVLAGEVPIAATIGTLIDDGTSIFAVTSGTSIPWGSAPPELHPPEPHPREDTLSVLDPEDLRTLWAWRGEQSLHGLLRSGPWLVVGVGPKPDQDRPDRHGVLVFDTRRAGSGAERLAASCSTGSPVFFRFAAAPDGRIAVVGFPERVGDAVRGQYAVTLFL
jgi:hypothetical protein